MYDQDSWQETFDVRFARYDFYAVIQRLRIGHHCFSRLAPGWLISGEPQPVV
jgi:hypothetical protein